MRPLLLVFTLFFVFQSLCPADELPKIDRSLVFIGRPDSGRGQDFLRFLRERFVDVQAVDLSDSHPEMLADADVVLLDWSQQDEGIISWFGDPKTERLSPLGDLEDYDRPTVLLGSAGLNIATLWGLPGSYG